jgi:folate-binding protein YgfZ
MQQLQLHDFLQTQGARFTSLNGVEAVSDFGQPEAEHGALRETAGVLDLSFRSRLCLTGGDRVRFLHGQVTNDVKSLAAGQGCYAALVTAKGRMESDLNIYCLTEELLLDFEPGLATPVARRLEKYIVADDVQVVDVATAYSLLSVQGPKSGRIISDLGIWPELPKQPLEQIKVEAGGWGEVYLMNKPRTGFAGFDLFVPTEALQPVAQKLMTAAKSAGGVPCGWAALEIARVEAGIPRFGADMDDSNFPRECGIEAQAVSYTKGCYIGQEVLNRIHTMGHVNKQLRGLRLADSLSALPVKGDKLFQNDKEVGYVTSAVVSKSLRGNIALGLVRNEGNAIGTELALRTAGGESTARVVELPFHPL